MNSAPTCDRSPVMRLTCRQVWNTSTMPMKPSVTQTKSSERLPIWYIWRQHLAARRACRQRAEQRSRDAPGAAARAHVDRGAMRDDHRSTIVSRLSEIMIATAAATTASLTARPTPTAPPLTVTPK